MSAVTHRVLVVATAGAGGDLQPLVAAALALKRRGHEVFFLGDESVERALRGLNVPIAVLSRNLHLAPRLVTAIRDAMALTGGNLVAAGPVVRERMSVWAAELAGPVREVVRDRDPAAIVTSLFGVEVLHAAAVNRPWAVVNSTFYVGPNPPRPLAEDFGPRAIPLVARYASLLESADLVLHATDPVFDFSFKQLPERHRYVGPLGIWEPARERPAYLSARGDPWALVTISSQLQDDVVLAEAALAALASRPLRAVVTLGPDHDPAELGSVPVKVRVERTVPHAAVLEHAALLVSHAGHGSVMKALWYGRPMVLVPWGRDQPGVAARAAALGVARVVDREEASPQSLAAAIDAVLGNEAMRREAQRQGARLRQTDPPAVAAALLELLFQ